MDYNKYSKKNVEGFILKDMYDLCYTAHRNTSFFPEKRAVFIIKEYSDLLESDLKELGENKGNYKEKFIDYFTNWMTSKGRCLSSMITGGSNFPVRKAENANANERNKSVAFQNWRIKYFKAVNRIPTKSPEDDMIITERWLQASINLQLMMKEINKDCRKLKFTSFDDCKSHFISKDYSESVISSIGCHGGFYSIPSFKLTNNNANINRWKKKMKELEIRIERKKEWQDIIFDGGYITIEDDRLKIFHDEKPSQDIINEIKSNGYKWSPKWQCWCRKHTSNAIYSIKSLSFIK